MKVDGIIRLTAIRFKAQRNGAEAGGKMSLDAWPLFAWLRGCALLSHRLRRGRRKAERNENCKSTKTRGIRRHHGTLRRATGTRLMTSNEMLKTAERRETPRTCGNSGGRRGPDTVAFLCDYVDKWPKRTTCHSILMIGEGSE